MTDNGRMFSVSQSAMSSVICDALAPEHSRREWFMPNEVIGFVPAAVTDANGFMSPVCRTFHPQVPTVPPPGDARAEGVPLS